MMQRVLYVYKWATMGGVERVLLNRALAFKLAKTDIAQDVFFLHDSGGKKLLNNYIEDKSLNQYLQIVEKFEPEKYDVIHAIDTPEIFEMMKNHEKVLFECHTAYTENRQYLAKLPLNIKGVAVPSEKFKLEIMEEIPLKLKEKVYVLNNFIPESMFEPFANPNKRFEKTPITYIGRVDKLKNVEEVVKIFIQLQKTLGDHFLLVIVGPITPEVDLMALIEKEGLVNRFIYIPPVSFEHIPKLLKFVKENDGIVISASTGESFGLSVAEAIVYNIPVIASHIHGHLVEEDSTFLYKLYDIKEAVEKVDFIVNNREYCLQKLSTHKRVLTDEVFLKDWEEYISKTSI